MKCSNSDRYLTFSFALRIYSEFLQDIYQTQNFTTYSEPIPVADNEWGIVFSDADDWHYGVYISEQNHAFLYNRNENMELSTISKMLASILTNFVVDGRIEIIIPTIATAERSMSLPKALFDINFAFVTKNGHAPSTICDVEKESLQQWLIDSIKCMRLTSIFLYIDIDNGFNDTFTSDQTSYVIEELTKIPQKQLKGFVSL